MKKDTSKDDKIILPYISTPRIIALLAGGMVAVHAIAALIREFM